MIFGFMSIVLNGGDYLWYSLLNTYSLAEAFPGSKIAIVEGADSFSDPQISTEDGLSIDGTKEVIDSFPDPLGIIKYYPLGKVKDKRELRQKGLELLKDSEVIVIRDHDEFIDLEDFKKIADILPEFSVIELQHYLFKGSFDYRYTDAHGNFTLRLYKNHPELTYSNWHIFPMLRGQEIHRIFTSKRTGIPFYHYGYVSTWYRTYVKRIFTVRQLNWFFPNKRPNIKYKVLAPPVLEEYRDQIPKYPFDRMVKMMPEDHPIEIRTHPWFGKSVEEIWNWPDKFPTFIPDRWKRRTPETELKSGPI